jgi:hypothetical protein
MYFMDLSRCSKPVGCHNYWITSLHGKVVSCRILHPLYEISCAATRNTIL